MASCSCRGNFAPNRLCMCGCMHERAPKAAVDAYARRGHRHRRAWRGYIAFQAASTRAYIYIRARAYAGPMPMRVVYMRELVMDFSHVYLRSEPRLRTRQHRGAGRHHSAHAQRTTVLVASRGPGAALTLRVAFLAKRVPRFVHARSPPPALWPWPPNCESANLDFNSGLPTTSQ